MVAHDKTIYSHLSRTTLVVFMVFVCNILFVPFAKAFHLGVGAGGVEEGDDRLRPYVATEVGLFNEFLNARLIAYGMKYSIVSQQSAIVSVSVRPTLPIASTKRFFANIGLWGLREITKLEATENADTQSETLVSYGILLGVRFKAIDAKYFYCSIDWDGHLYLPGAAFVTLSTGRRQTIGLNFGISL